MRKVVDDLMRRLEHNTRETLRGALNRSQRTRRPRHADIDWPRTIRANLRHYQPQHGTVVPETPAKTHLVLITDLYEGGDANSMLARATAIKQSGVNLIVLLALSDSGHPGYEAKNAEAIASIGCPVFACTPDQFPSMMAFALTGRSLHSWAADEDVAVIRGS